jgi:hypothetical protein
MPHHLNTRNWTTYQPHRMLCVMKVHTSDRTLYALFCLSRDTLPIDAGSVGQLTGLSATQTAVDLIRLESQGYVDASRARLTMLGLARAAQLSRRYGGGPRSATGWVPRQVERVLKPPVAAKPHPDSHDNLDNSDTRPSIAAVLRQA